LKAGMKVVYRVKKKKKKKKEGKSFVLLSKLPTPKRSARLSFAEPAWKGLGEGGKG